MMSLIRLELESNKKHISDKITNESERQTVAAKTREDNLIQKLTEFSTSTDARLTTIEAGRPRDKAEIKSYMDENLNAVSSANQSRIEQAYNVMKSNHSGLETKFVKLNTDMAQELSQLREQINQHQSGTQDPQTTKLLLRLEAESMSRTLIIHGMDNRGIENKSPKTLII